MKLTKAKLQKIIKEEIKTAIREELQDILVEAVKIASAPENNQSVKEVVKESQIRKPQPKPSNLFGNSQDPIMNLLNETQKEMTEEEYRNIITADSTSVPRPNFASSIANQMGMGGTQPGIDISKLDFVSKAKKVLDLSNQKDKFRKGL